MTRITTPLLALAASLALSPALAQDRSAATSGTFTEEQAARGQELYDNFCSACHGVDLVATDSEAATLTGGQFTFAWARSTLNERHDRIATTMPPGNGGMLEPQEYADIVAYILSFNGYPTGDAELTPEVLAAETINVGRL